ncbi:MAG: OmpA family protein [Prevotella sp.]
MKTLKTLLVAALLSLGLAAQAQDADYTFKKHAFLQLQGGVQHTLGEAKFGDLLSPNIQAALGYQFSPIFGARLAVNGWQSKGGYSGYKESDGANPGNIQYKYKYVSPTIDFMFNLSNLIWGYNPVRLVNVSAFVGGGLNIGFSNDEANDIAARGYNMTYLWDGTKVLPVGKAGIAVDFRLSDAVALGIEGNANVLSDKYNSKKAENADWYFNVLAGLKINLGKSYEKVVPPAPAPVVVEPEPEPVVEPAPVVEEIKVIEPLRIDVFFTINVSKITESEENKVKELVEFMNKYPNKKVQVTGYADAGTGNDKINDRLAAQRAAAVVKMLTEKYGIAADRISSDSKGSRVQPFAENDMNRVSICITD